MNRIARTLLATVVTSALLSAALAAAEQPQRYIVILKQRAGAPPDVASLGGVIESRQDEQLVVTIPAGSLAALKADQKVRYIERVGGQPSAAEDVLIGEPADPQPGLPSQSKRSVPHTLGSTPWDSGTYAYDGAGNIIAIGNDNYLYDGAQRLKQSSTKGTGETYTYDGFGNMKTRTNTTIPQVDATTNRYVGYTYNEIGAVAADGSYTFSYDPLGQPLSKTYPGRDSEYYLYTASDERIGVQRGGWWTWSARDESGKVLRQYKSSVTNPSAPALWLEDYVWRDGLLLGSQRPVEMGGRRHFHLDHLGTPRLVTSDNGQRVSSHDYYPFGDEQTTVWQEVAGGFDREDPMKFTGHERDYAGGMGGEDGHAVDYMHARYYGPGVGRFLSVDPMEGNTRHPQSWDRYSYVANQPIKNIDPKGLCTFTLTGGEKYSDDNTVCAETAAKNPSDLEYRMTMANIAAVENLHYSGMFLNWVAREFSTPFLMFSQGLMTDRPLPIAAGVASSAGIAFGGVVGPEEEELLLLNKQLASESQVADALAGGGQVIAGEGASVVLRDEARLVAEYGPGSWAKMTSGAYKAADGHIIETHFYKNVTTGQIVEFKSTLPWH